MKFLFFLAVLFSIPGIGFGQGAALDNEVDAELDHLYSNQVSNQVSNKQAPTVSEKNAVPTQNVQAAQPIYILNQSPANQSTNVQTSVHKQPTTFVEASPMVESKAEQIRKSRIDAEASTETKIVEKLEQSRLEDEKKRADVLFGNKFDQLNNKSAEANTQSTPQLNQAPVQAQPVLQVQSVQQPIPVQVVNPYEKEEKETLSRDVVKEEIKAALDAEKEVPLSPLEQKYFSALVGFPDYPDSSNIKGNYSLGASFGTKYDDAYAVEGSFIFSNYTLNPIYYNGYVAPDMDVNQYGLGLGLKYFMFSGMVKPFVGGLMQYNYRTYAWAQNVGYSNNGTTNSQAIDVGLNVGADIAFNSKFTLGIDYRYYFNMSSRKDNSAFVYQPFYGTPLEQVSSSLLSVSAKVQF